MNIKKVISMFMAMIIILGCSASTEVAFAGTKAETIVGAPTQKTWTFEADKSGTYKIVFTYARPWENASSDTKTVVYTVKISDEKSTDSNVVTLDADKENTVKLGQKFSVILEENASTGYSWSYNIKDNGIAFINTESEPLIGAPVNREWTFTAGKSGTYKIVFTYARSWEKESSDSKTVEYTIKVVNKKCTTFDSVGLVEGKVNTICKKQQFCITLEENASTGYSWSYKTRAKAIKLTKDETFSNEGEPTQTVWTFTANKSGTYKIVFTYARSWEKDSSDTKEVEYTVKVTDDNKSEGSSVALDDSSIALIEGQDNTVKLGQKFFVSLEENASTGYSWNYSIIGNAITISE